MWQLSFDVLFVQRFMFFTERVHNEPGECFGGAAEHGICFRYFWKFCLYTGSCTLGSECAMSQENALPVPPSTVYVSHNF